MYKNTSEVLRFKLILLCAFTILPLLLFSQKTFNREEFKQKVKTKSDLYTSNEDFAKTQSFFIQEELDSILVYTNKLLIRTPNQKAIEDYCHFFRGYSFYKKEVFKQAEKEFLKVSKEFDFIFCTEAFLGAIALEQSEFQKSITYNKAIESLPSELLLITNIANIKYNIGVCYLHLEQYDLAETYLKENIALIEQEKDTLGLVGSYGTLATLYYEQYKDDKAIPYFKKAYEVAKSVDDFVTKKNAALNMATVEENRKDYPKALIYLKEHNQWKDSLNDLNTIYATAKAEEKVAIEREQKRIIKLQAKTKVKTAERNTFLYSALILLLMLGVSLYLYREKIKRNKIINDQKENLDELNTTKDKLFSIVSHDLRSSVNAIKISNKKLVDKLEAENRNEVNSLLQNNSAIVNGAYNLLDNLLNWALLQTKQSFFKISKLRLAVISEHVIYNYKAILADKNITFKNSISKKDIVYADKESLKIIIRNLIDNAIKFTNSGGTIRMYSNNEHADFCDLIIEDTGIGMDAETQEELLKETALLSKKKHEDIIGTGLGMQLCKSMIKKNNGIFSIKSELGKGTKMMISLPKNLPNEPN